MTHVNSLLHCFPLAPTRAPPASWKSWHSSQISTPGVSFHSRFFTHDAELLFLQHSSGSRKVHNLFLTFPFRSVRFSMIWTPLPSSPFENTRFDSSSLTHSNHFFIIASHTPLLEGPVSSLLAHSRRDHAVILLLLPCPRSSRDPQTPVCTTTETSKKVCLISRRSVSLITFFLRRAR